MYIRKEKDNLTLQSMSTNYFLAAMSEQQENATFDYVDALLDALYNTNKKAAKL